MNNISFLYLIVLYCHKTNVNEVESQRSHFIFHLFIHLYCRTMSSSGADGKSNVVVEVVDDEAIVQSFVDGMPSEDRRSLDLELQSFVIRHASHHRPIALVSSGGTAADLEVNSVRCLDNFSTGKRGAISVEGE